MQPHPNERARRITVSHHLAAFAVVAGTIPGPPKTSFIIVQARVFFLAKKSDNHSGPVKYMWAVRAEPRRQGTTGRGAVGLPRRQSYMSKMPRACLRHAAVTLTLKHLSWSFSASMIEQHKFTKKLSRFISDDSDISQGPMDCCCQQICFFHRSYLIYTSSRMEAVALFLYLNHLVLQSQFTASD